MTWASKYMGLGCKSRCSGHITLHEVQPQKAQSIPSLASVSPSGHKEGDPDSDLGSGWETCCSPDLHLAQEAGGMEGPSRLMVDCCTYLCLLWSSQLLCSASSFLSLDGSLHSCAFSLTHLNHLLARCSLCVYSSEFLSLGAKCPPAQPTAPYLPCTASQEGVWPASQLPESLGAFEELRGPGLLAEVSTRPCR